MQTASSPFYRISAMLLLLFATHHIFGNGQRDGVDGLLSGVRFLHCDVQARGRTCWDLFAASGFFAGVFYMFSAILAWQLSRLPAATLALVRGITWAFALCFAAITILSWIYFFIEPFTLSLAITICLAFAALLCGRQAPMRRNQSDPALTAAANRQ